MVGAISMLLWHLTLLGTAAGGGEAPEAGTEKRTRKRETGRDVVPYRFLFLLPVSRCDRHAWVMLSWWCRAGRCTLQFIIAVDGRPFLARGYAEVDAILSCLLRGCCIALACFLGDGSAWPAKELFFMVWCLVCWRGFGLLVCRNRAAEMCGAVAAASTPTGCCYSWVVLTSCVLEWLFVLRHRPPSPPL